MLGFLCKKCHHGGQSFPLDNAQRSNMKLSNGGNKNKDPKYIYIYAARGGALIEGARDAELAHVNVIYKCKCLPFGGAYESGLPAGKYAPRIYLLVHKTQRKWKYSPKFRWVSVLSLNYNTGHPFK